MAAKQNDSMQYGIRNRRNDKDNVTKDDIKDTCQVQKSAERAWEHLIGSYWLTRIVFLRALSFIYCTFDFEQLGKTLHTRTIPRLYRGTIPVNKDFGTCNGCI